MSVRSHRGIEPRREGIDTTTLATTNMSIFSPTFVDAIGLVGTSLTAIGFAQSNFALKEPQGPTVKIKGIVL
jgi:hypothetical protein